MPYIQISLHLRMHHICVPPITINLSPCHDDTNSIIYTLTLYKMRNLYCFVYRQGVHGNYNVTRKLMTNIHD